MPLQYCLKACPVWAACYKVACGFVACDFVASSGVDKSLEISCLMLRCGHYRSRLLVFTAFCSAAAVAIADQYAGCVHSGYGTISIRCLPVRLSVASHDRSAAVQQK